MKLSEFILLTAPEKKSLMMKQAVPLAHGLHNNRVVFLFQLENYYVETYCNPADKSVMEYRVLPDTNAIRHYLEAISIESLLQ